MASLSVRMLKSCRLSGIAHKGAQAIVRPQTVALRKFADAAEPGICAAISGMNLLKVSLDTYDSVSQHVHVSPEIGHFPTE